MNEEVIYEQNRLKELAKRSYNTGHFMFTDFLSLAEQSTFYEIEKELRFASPLLFGGTDMCERKMIRFGDPNELGYEEDFPIAALLIEPVAAKFADDLTHRDFLGALMNLGIKRELLGDIFVKESKALVFCKESIKDYIIDNLSRIRHTTVKLSVTEDVSFIATPNLEEKTLQVASLRADAVISKVFNLSRNESLLLFQNGLVFIGGRECTENAKQLNPGDIVSVRGHGRFEFVEAKGVSRKGKTNCIVRKW